MNSNSTEPFTLSNVKKNMREYTKRSRRKKKLISIIIFLFILSAGIIGYWVLKDCDFESFFNKRSQEKIVVQDPSKEDDGSFVRVARISLIENSVTLKRGDDNEWHVAVINMPIQSGDRISTNDSGLLEIQFEKTLLWLDSNTSFELLDLSKDRSQVALYKGTILATLRDYPKQPIEIDTPSGAVVLSEAGKYRIFLNEENQTEIWVQTGKAEVFNGNTNFVVAGQRLVLKEGELEAKDLPTDEDQDKWNRDRDNQLQQASQNSNFIGYSQTVAGIDDLDRYGEWVNSTEYGMVWIPTAQNNDWAPYREGQWIWRDPYGWTWVSSEPWGWAPYHYGRWAFFSNRWCWVPGGDKHYSPAHIGFIDYKKNNIIGWVPLAPNEKNFKWWGKKEIGNQIPTIFANQKNTNSVTITSKDGFISGKINHRDIIAREDFKKLSSHPITRLDIVPTQRSLAPRVISSAIHSPVNESHFRQHLINKNTNLPQIRPFIEKVAEIKERKGEPVSHVQKITKPPNQQVQNQPRPANVTQPPQQRQPTHTPQTPASPQVNNPERSRPPQQPFHQGQSPSSPSPPNQQVQNQPRPANVTQPPQQRQPTHTPQTPASPQELQQRERQRQQAQERQRQQQQAQERQRQQQQEQERQRQQQAQKR